MNRSDKLILLTNDDGIDSPGLRAAALTLAAIGWVTVVAPREQWTGAGRSMPRSSGGIIHTRVHEINGAEWEVYAVDGTPAQVVQHGLLEVVSRKPDLVVAGINYGENVGTGVTISGTVGAALEAASFGIPALAVSLETPKEYHHSYSHEIDFSVAANFTKFFADLILTQPPVPDVDVWKIDIPEAATPETPWHITRQSRQRYFVPMKPQREQFSDHAQMDYDRKVASDEIEPGSDVAAIILDKVISVTPLSLDLTSRVDLRMLEEKLKK